VLKAGPTSEKRVLSIVDALIGGLRARGHDVRLTDTSQYRHKLEAVIAGRGVEFWLGERIDRTEMSAAELAKRDKLSVLGGDRYKYAPSGDLVLEISAPWGDSSIRRRWADGAKQKVENVVGDVVLGLERSAAAWARADEEHERARKQREDDERKAAAERRRAAHRTAMSDHLSKAARRWQEAQTITAFLAAGEARVPASERSPAFSEWLAWAEGHARQLEGDLLGRSDGRLAERRAFRLHPRLDLLPVPAPGAGDRQLLQVLCERDARHPVPLGERRDGARPDEMLLARQADGGFRHRRSVAHGGVRQVTPHVCAPLEHVCARSVSGDFHVHCVSGAGGQ
jgi:hypothetical protein